jgi:deoxyadenosine/deoxycytidine kinase
MQQIQDLKQRSLFETVRVADFLIEKDRLFAEVTLSNEEMDLYDKVYDHITLDAPSPDLVIYLQAPIDVLKDRITKRGNINEQYLTLEYLERLNDAYSRFFLDYNDAPLLIINAADINLESNENDYESLITKIMSNPKGKNFINPQPSIL